MGDKIALIPIKGPISGESQLILSLGAQTSPRLIREHLEESERDDDVKGLIVEIDSPGGTPYPSRELAKAVKNLEKPTVAWIRENGLSGAYWIASSCDKIVADELSNVGGIGVAAVRPDFSELLEKLGIKLDSSATGEHKELGLPFGKAGKEDKELIEKRLEAVSEIFTEEVAENRGLEEKEIKKISEGAPYLGKEAKEMGLIDRLGSREEAIQVCKELSRAVDAEIVDYEEKVRKEPGLLGGLLDQFFK